MSDTNPMTIPTNDQPEPPQNSGARTVGWIMAGIVGLLLIATALDGGGSDDPSDVPDTDTSSVVSQEDTDAAKAEVAWAKIGQASRDSICETYRVSPDATHTMMLGTDGFTPGTADATMDILARDC